MISIQTVSCLEKILPNKPYDAEKRGSKLQNEHYAFQVVVEGGEALQGASLSVDGDFAPFVETYLVQNVPTKKPYGLNPDPYVLTTPTNEFPDLLLPFDGEIRTVEERVCVWVNVLPSCPVGTHEIVVSLSKNGETLTKTAYELEVIQETGKQGDLFLTNWMHYDGITHLHHVEPFSAEYYEVFDKYLRLYVECGHNALLTPLVTPALDTAVGGERLTTQLVEISYDGTHYSFGLEKLDEFVKFAKARGIKYFELSHLFTQWGAKFAPKIMVHENGKTVKKFGWETESDSEEYQNFLKEYLAAICAYVKQKGLENAVVFHLSDEPSAEALEHYGKLYAFVKEQIGKLKTIDALSEYDFYERKCVDVPVVITVGCKTYREHSAAHIAYYCSWPCSNYDSNRFIAMSGERARIIGTQLYANDAKGFLHWGYNFYNAAFSTHVIDPFKSTDSDGRFPAGDPFIVYPDVANKGAFKSMRYYYMQQAFEDYAALNRLAEKRGKAVVENLLAEYGIEDYNRYPQTPTAFHQFRERLNGLLKE